MKKLAIFTLLFFAHSLFAQSSEQQNSKQQSLSMIQPITITVGGDFIVNGSFQASAMQRVDNIITLLYIEAFSNLITQAKSNGIAISAEGVEAKYPLRNITLKRASGETSKIDLLKFRLTGDFSQNPYLKNDDVIIFPAYDDSKNSVEVIGAVNKPIKFQFVDGDRLSDAIQFCGGLNLAYTNVTKAEILRYNDVKRNEERIVVDISNNPLLNRGDVIRILADENEKKFIRVLVLGEIKYPGYVVVSNANSTVKNVIDLAGGFTRKADIRRAELLRSRDETQYNKMKAIRDFFEKDSTFTTLPLLQKTVEELQAEELKMYRTNTLTEEQLRIAFNIDNSLRFIESHGVVDFSKLDSDSSQGNFNVKNGDVIVIPEIQDFVYVFGQVDKPGYIKFRPGEDWSFYIEKAGGLTESAEDIDEAKVITSKDRTWKSLENTKIERGDFIYVPKNIPKNLPYYLSNIGSAAGIIGSITTIVLLLIQLSK
ncbi:MAG: SLBB domain-containing protein [Melioribacteraceae bacterium]